VQTVLVTIKCNGLEEVLRLENRGLGKERPLTQCGKSSQLGIQEFGFEQKHPLLSEHVYQWKKVKGLQRRTSCDLVIFSKCHTQTL